MRMYNRPTSFSNFQFSSMRFSAVKVLIIINILVFIFINLLRSPPWLLLFGLVPRFVFMRFMLWQLFTYLFVHVGLWHLVFNMLMLWFFGQVIEDIWGRKDFLTYYFFTGIGAGLFSVIFGFGSFNPIVGASGAIFGLLVAYTMMFPDNIILLFFLIPMKMRHALLVLVGINLLGALSAPGSGIAYLAHLSGGFLGYLYLKSDRLRFKISSFSLHDLKSSWKEKELKRHKRAKEELDQKVDLILDKISKHGMNSLSREERRILEEKSRPES